MILLKLAQYTRLPHCLAGDRACVYLPPERRGDAETEELVHGDP
jgi:hypothetical protein